MTDQPRCRLSLSFLETIATLELLMRNTSFGCMTPHALRHHRTT